MKMDKAVDVVRSRTSAKVTIHANGMLKVIYASDISYIEVMRNSVTYHTTQGDFKVRSSMKDVESAFAGSSFVRCNVCYLVHLRYVTQVCADCVTVGGDELHISRAKRKQFLEALTDYLGRSV